MNKRISFHHKVKQAIQMVRIARERNRRIEWFQYDYCECHRRQGLSFGLDNQPAQAFH